MSLAKLVQERVDGRGQGGLPCRAGNLLINDVLDKEDKKFFTFQLSVQFGDGGYVPAITLSKALGDLGIKVGEKAIRTHRANMCNCKNNIRPVK